MGHPKVDRVKKLEIKSLRRQLNLIELERQFKWKTPKYQQAHTELLDKQEEKIMKKLEAIR